MRRPVLVVTALALLAAAVVAAAQDDGDRAPDDGTVPAFSPGDGRATLAHASNGWLVWTDSETTGDPRYHVRMRKTRYYVQRPGDDEARPAYEMSGTYSKHVMTVLDDGTLLLHYIGGVTWARADGTVDDRPSLRIGDERSVVLSASPEGALLQPYRLNENAPVFFVPIRDGELEIESRVAVTQEDVSVNHRGPTGGFVVAGGVVAWERYAIDVRTGRRWTFADNVWCPAACDGETLIVTERLRPNQAWHQSVEFLRSERAATRHEMPGRRSISVPMFAVRNAIGYRVVPRRQGAPEEHHSFLQAVDLKRDGGRAVDLLRLPRIPLDHNTHTLKPRPRVPHVVTDEGLTFWDGEAWRLVEWLEEMPSER